MENGYTETYPVPINEKDQQYRSIAKPSSGDYPLKAENEEYFIKIDGSGTTMSASLPAPDANTPQAALTPDGGAISDLMIKPDVCVDNEKREN